MTKKIGRPTDNPKIYKITVRLDEKSKSILEKYCQEMNVKQTEAIREGILRLEGDIKK